MTSLSGLLNSRVYNNIIIDTYLGAVGMNSEAAADKHHLSQRGAYNFAHRDVWGPRQKSMGNAWSPTNPNGT